MSVRAPSRRRWASSHSSRCWCCAWPGLRRSRCRSAASTLPARPPGWPHVVTSVRRSPSPAVSRPVARWCGCAATAGSSSRRSPPGRICCPRWASALPVSRRWSRRSERGSATVIAAAMVAVLLSVTGGSAYLGSAVVARHRAQAAADLAALAAAAGLAAGPETACVHAEAVAASDAGKHHRLRRGGSGRRRHNRGASRCRRVGQRAGRRSCRPGRQGLVAGGIRIGQARVGEFGRRGQSQADQSGEGLLLDFNPVDRHMHRNPVAVVARHAQHPAGGPGERTPRSSPPSSPRRWDASAGRRPRHAASHRTGTARRAISTGSSYSDRTTPGAHRAAPTRAGSAARADRPAAPGRPVRRANSSPVRSRGRGHPAPVRVRCERQSSPGWDCPANRCCPRCRTGCVLVPG